jgi:pimeloyl-ACP methyl ester carboxylesterase
MIAERRADIAGLGHAWLEAGAGGTPLLMLHGIGSGAASWAPVLPALAAGRRVIAWNLPGYGGAGRLPAPHPGPADYAAALLAFLDAQNLDRIDLLGHSLGGLLAAYIARHHPALVRRLILSSPAGGYRLAADAELPPALAARIADVRTLGPAGMAEKRAANMVGPGTDPAILARVRETMAAVDPDGYEQAVWLLAQGDVAGWAAAITMPAEIIVGSADRVTKPEGVAAIAELIPRARYRLIEGAGHASYADHAALYAELVAGFLAD